MNRFSVLLLVAPAFCLAGLGIVMLLSTGAFADTAAIDLYFSAKRQMLWMGLGLFGASLLAMIDYRVWQKFIWPAYIGGCLLLLCCFIPGIAAVGADGEPINGSRRWITASFIGLRSLRFQPSELAKLTTLAALAAWYATRPTENKQWKNGFLLPCLILGLPVLLIGLEQDLGSAALLAVAGFCLMFIAGSRISGLTAIALSSLVGLATAVYFMPNRLARIFAFMDLEGTRMGAGLQQWRALLAFGSGGIEGLGLGNGRQKMSYLPFAHTDFIFPIIGEELGLFFSLAVVSAFVFILIGGMIIATHAPNHFGKLLAVAMVTLITVQAFINIGVTTAVLPNKGIPLPFVSYGGSNLLACMLSLGLLISIYRMANPGKIRRAPILARSKITPRL